MSDARAGGEALEDLLVEHAGALESFVRGHAGPRLLRFETVEDLAQGIQVDALRSAGGYEYRGPEAFRAWLFKTARHYMYRRAAHWYALKRGSGGIVRLVDRETGGLDPAASGPSPSSFASRRELLVAATRALETLRSRDRDLLQRSADGATIEELADAFDLSYEAAKKARLRAAERLRKAVRLVLAASEASRGTGGEPGEESAE